jgi:CBS domain containing-hemolysin-like protein
MEILTFGWQFTVILLLVFANAFFVAAEFAIVKVRHTQLEPMLGKGNWRVPIALNVTKHLDAYLSATQLGITISSLGLGWLGEPFLADWIGPLVHYFGITSPTVIHSVSFSTAFLLITFLHIVLGELAPKSLAIQRPRRITLWVSPPLVIFYYVFFPLIWVLNGAANQMLRWVGIPPATEGDHAFTPEELQYLLMHSTHVHPGDALVNNIMIKALRLKETTAEQIMLPADKVAVLWRDRSLQENLMLAQKAGYSRMPLCGNSLEQVLGIIHIKELLWQLQVLGDQTKLESIMHSILTFTPKTTLPTMLELFRQSRTHLAVVVDSEDRMIGIVSFEDVLEELVGDIRDEFDVEKGPFFERTQDSVLVDADLPLRDLAIEMDWPLPTHTTDTVDKWCLEKWGRIPEKGEELHAGDIRIEAVETSKRGLRRVRLTRQAAGSESAATV